MRRRLARAGTLLGVAVVMAACAKPPVSDELTIDLSRHDGNVVVTAETNFIGGGSGAARAHLDAARSSAQNGTDAWAVRLGRINAETDRVTFERNHGTLERVVRSVTIPTGDLQQVFSDSNITVSLVEGEGWRELTFYPGTSSRASREQQARFNAELNRWSTEAARYFNAVAALYAYMNHNPERAPFLFAAVLNEKGVDGSDPVVMEEEQPLVDAVSASMEQIAARMDEEEAGAQLYAEEADLVFNPFPARVKIRVDGDVIASEGFSKDLTIEPVDLGGAIMSLENRWIEPDPLVLLLRDRIPAAEDLAKEDRRAEPMVTAASIEQAIREQVARPRSYMVRWRE